MTRPEIIGVNSATPPNPPQVPNVHCGHVVVLVSPTTPETTGQQLALPGNCITGDVVEFYSTGSSEACTILAPVGESFVNNGPSIGGGGSALCRKVSPTEWVNLA